MRLPDVAAVLHKSWKRLRQSRRELNSKNLTFIVRANQTQITKSVPFVNIHANEHWQQIVLSSVAAFAAVSYVVVSFFKARRQRQKHGQKVGWVGRWSFLNALGRKRGDQGRYEQTFGDNFDGTSHSHPLETTATSDETNDCRQTLRRTHLGRTSDAQDGALVDRNTSIRSVMTLPVYRAIAGHNERVIGREGERGGVDVVVEFPTAEEEEFLRREEMEAIYQIRLARRQQAAEREESRRQIHEVRQRGDSNAVAEARSRSRTASTNGTVEELRQDVNRIREQRQRSVSSVSYADLGVARHDGTRIRANSNESEQMGLLSDAASIAVSTFSDARSPGFHRRQHSASSLVSVDSDLHPNHPASRVRSHPSKLRLSGSSGEIGTGSRLELVEVDLGTEPLPLPQYENASHDDNVEAQSPTNSARQPPPEYAAPDQVFSPGSDGATSFAHIHSSNETQVLSTGEVPGVIGDIPRLPSLRLPVIVVERITDENSIQNS